jgi:hypothetical protein
MWQASAAQPAAGFVLHQAVTVRAAEVEFYAGHLVLDAQGSAALDDGTLHVRADRIIFDITNEKYVAAGDVIVDGHSTARGAALGIDLHSQSGVLIAVGTGPSTYSVKGGDISPSTAPVPASVLALPELGGEEPFVDAAQAVVHLGADVRLAAAHVLVPGGRSVVLPSYVYVYSSETGYSLNNVANSGEDVPIIFGSTRDSIDAAHFTYNSVSKIGFGLDHRIIDGDKAYDLFSISPLNGPDKNAAFTWQEQIDNHAAQTLLATDTSGVGAFWNYTATDQLHRSFLQLTGTSSLPGNDEELAWQGAYEPLGPGWLSLFTYHLRTQYDRSQSFSASSEQLYAKSFESQVQTTPFVLDPSSSLALSADWRETFDNQPHQEFAADYTATLTHRWDPMFSTSLTDSELPTVDTYPSLAEQTRFYLSQQVASVTYSHGDALAFSFLLTHQASYSSPNGQMTQPWFTSLDVRFRVTPSLSLDLSRSYGFNFEGQRFGPFGVQIFP